jgi:hypothetical protein
MFSLIHIHVCQVYVYKKYQVTPSGGGSGDHARLKFIGTYAGHVVEFKVSQ